MATAAARLGVPVQDMPRMGAVLLRFIAAVNPGNVPQLTAGAGRGLPVLDHVHRRRGS